MQVPLPRLLSEPEKNSLRVILPEAKVGDPPTAEQLAEEASPEGRELLAGSKAIYRTRVSDI